MAGHAIQLNAITRLFWRAHRFLYLATGGRIGARLLGWQIILLKTTGRKSGRPRTVTLNALEDAGRLVVVASYAGQPTHPAWFLNLQAQPRAEILDRRRWRTVTAVAAQDAERDRLWEMIVRRDAAYAEYQSRTERQIPVVILTPEEQSRSLGRSKPKEG